MNAVARNLLRTPARLLLLALLTIPLSAGARAQAIAMRAEAGGRGSSTPPHVRGQIIVKFKSSLTECAHCFLAKGRSFSAALSDGSSSLDELNRKYSVSGGRSVFVDREGKTTAAAQAGQTLLREDVKRRFNKRAARAPTHAAQPDLTNVYVLNVPADADVEAISREFAADPHVEYALPNYLIHVTASPNDPYFGSSHSSGQVYDDLWGVKKIGAPAAWDVTQGLGITVAVVDTGVDYNHPDIAANIVPGWNFIGNTDDPMDDNGHGTHVAGTIAAVGNNGVGVIGVAPQARIMPLKAFDNTGLGSIDGLAAAIVYAAQHGADVINNSWACGNPGCVSDPVIEDAVRSAYGSGVVSVFAAGNDRLKILSYSPQNMTDAKPVVVAATDPFDAAAIFSNLGILIDVGAPGTDILSLRASVCDPSVCDPAFLVGDRYLRLYGTSMAAPHVSGTAALVLSHHPDLTNEEVRLVLRASADDAGTPGFDRRFGEGRVNALRALAIGSVPQAAISSPSPFSSFELTSTGFVEVRGSATGAGFTEYRLFYSSPLSPNDWLPVSGPVTTPVSQGTLGSLSGALLPVGLYGLKLVCHSSTSVSSEAFSQFSVEPGIKRLSTLPAYDLSPGVSGSRIVWTHTTNDPQARFHDEGFRSDSGDIYLYDLSTGIQQVIPNSGMAAFPSISGDRIVWVDYRSGFENGFNGEIYEYDLRSHTERPIAVGPGTRRDPAIAGNRVIWLQNDDITFEAPYSIRLFDLSTGTTVRVTSDSARPLLTGLYGDIAISGDRIVWVDSRNAFPEFEVFVYDLSTGAERQVTSASDVIGAPVAIDGDRLVWAGFRNGGWTLSVLDLATGTTRLIPTAVQGSWPRISGDRVVWSGWNEDNWDIYSYDLRTDSGQQITSQALDQVFAVISEDTVVWMDDRGGSHIYMYEFAGGRPALATARPRPRSPTVRR